MTVNAALKAFSGPIDKILEIPDLNEIMINAPHDVFYEVNGNMRRYDDSEKVFNLEYLERITRVIAFDGSDDLNKNKSILSATMPLQENHLARVQVVIPPSCAKGQYVISIRKPSTKQFTLEEYSDLNFFDVVNETCKKKQLTEEDQLLNYYKEKHDWIKFMKLAVSSKKNIIISGGTGAGKTRFTNCLLGYIKPIERLITIEDARECLIQSCDKKRNMVNLLTSTEAPSKSAVGFDELIKACLRLRPDRILMSELRGKEAYDFLNGINTGHNGSITSLHTNSGLSVYDRLVTMIKMSESGKGLSKEDIYDYCKNSIDIIMHCGKSLGNWRLEEVILRD